MKLRLHSIRNSTDRHRLRIVAVYALLLFLNVSSWIWATIAFSPQPVLLEIAVLAYSFGLRHAFDADHIAAIDNVVRKLTQERRRSCAVGLFFSLGHATVVVSASLLIALTATGLRDQLNKFQLIGGVIGTLVSIGFLLAVGVANLLVLRDIWQAFSRLARGQGVRDDDMEGMTAGSGLMTRLLRRTFCFVTRSCHMYPIGLLFGLGFDTATEIGILGISAAQATHNASVWNILIFPTLFTAGMSLVDFTDSVLMTKAYGWASIHPIKKLWYNLTTTATSVVVALFVGGLEAFGLIADKLGLAGGLWRWVALLNSELGLLGIGIVGFFAFAWLVSFTVYRLRGYDDKGAASARSAALLFSADTSAPPARARISP